MTHMIILMTDDKMTKDNNKKIYTHKLMDNILVSL